MAELTDKQRAFLDALFSEEVEGNVRKAMKIAGYSGTTPSSVVLKPLVDEIIERARIELAGNTPKAVLGVLGILDEPTALGAQNRLAAAKEVMDRAGIVKREKLDINNEGGPQVVFYLPDKNKDE